MSTNDQLKKISITLLRMDDGLDDLKCSAKALGCIRDLLMYMNPKESLDTTSLAELIDVFHKDFDEKISSIINEVQSHREDFN